MIALLAAFMLLVSVSMAAAEFCGGQRVPLDTSVGSLPFVHMRIGSLEGNFVIDTASTFSEIDARALGVAHGSRVRLEGSNFPTIGWGVFVALDPGGLAAPGGHESGAIGTDFLRSRTIEFHYDGAASYAVVSRHPCPAERLREAGFVAVAQDGYYEPTWRTTPHFRDDGGDGLAIPLVFIRIGPVTAPAWIDSGFYELAAYPPPGTVQVNPAPFAALRDAGVSLQPAGFVRNTNCDNEINQEPLWQVRDAPLAFTDQPGQVIREEPPPILQVPPEHNCAGPSALSEPLGMIGAAYLRK